VIAAIVDATRLGPIFVMGRSDRTPAGPTVIDEPITAEVIEACRRGDRGALDEVFRAHAGSLERLLARLVGPGADVEDLLQDTFAAAIDAFPRFRGEASVRAWLHRIAINVAHNHLRRPRHRREVAIEAEPAEATSVADRVASRDLAERLYVHLEKIEARKRIALILHVVEGCSIAEIAALTGASQTATKSRLFWARRALHAYVRRDPALRAEVGDDV
jgi:RNA polymerase sigma-70 factor (ECF subfamily)